jgi:hypothetical protein
VTAGQTDAAGDYAVLKRLPQLTPATAAAAPRVMLPVGTAGGSFGQVRVARVELAAPGWVITNIAAFPWSRVTVNGSEVALERQAAQAHRLALQLPAGIHVLQWEWRPDPIWRWLRLAAPWAAAALALLAAAGVARAVWPAGS